MKDRYRKKKCVQFDQNTKIFAKKIILIPSISKHASLFLQNDNYHVTARFFNYLSCIVVIFTIFQMCVETMHACDFLRKRFPIDALASHWLLAKALLIGWHLGGTGISFYFERFELFASSIFLFEIIVSIIANINELNNLLQFLFIFDVLRIVLLRSLHYNVMIYES